MILDSKETWPDNLRKYLDANCSSLVQYRVRERSRLVNDRDSNGRYIPTVLRSPNEFSELRDEILDGIEPFLQSETIRSWHCTRLTSSEIIDIKSHGLRPLNSKLVEDKINLAFAEGKFNEDVRETLLAVHLGAEDCREEKSYWVFNQVSDNSQSSSEELFRNWGGEAIWVPVHDTKIFSSLRCIGRPCLIEADIPTSSFSTSFAHNLSLSIESIVLSEVMDDNELKFDIEDVTASVVPANRIQHIHIFPCDFFSKFTGCDSWKPKLR